MIYIHTNQDHGPLYINAEHIVRFRYDSKLDATSITMTDGSTHTISSNCTKQIIDALRRIDKLSLVQIGD